MLKGGYFAHKCQNVKRKGKLVIYIISVPLTSSNNWTSCACPRRILHVALFSKCVGKHFIIKILKRYFFERIKTKTCLITNMIKGCIWQIF